MSDVWRDLIEEIRQKAKTPYHICTDEKLIGSIEKWVRVDDVLQAINQLKQNHVIIRKKKLKEKLAEIKLYGTKINGRLSDKPEYSPRYLADFIEKELLRENEV
jgi:hypothetical protein